MQNNELIFSGDCVLNLDDFGQFKDYTETLDQLQITLNSDKPNLLLLQEVLDADKQDIFHLPKFQSILIKCIQKQQVIHQCEQKQNLEHQKTKQPLKLKLFKLYLEILEQSFFSYICKQQTIEIVSQKLKQSNKGGINLKIDYQILNFLYKLSQSVNYIGSDDQQKIIPLFLGLSQRASSWINSQKQGSMYILVVDYFFRNRLLRNKISTLLDEILQKDTHQYLRLKLQLWKGNHKKSKQTLSGLKQKEYAKYLHQSIEYWSEKLK